MICLSSWDVHAGNSFGDKTPFPGAKTVLTHCIHPDLFSVKP